jgi:dTDP-4-dehydrorhamnose 3,5-epimerase
MEISKIEGVVVQPLKEIVDNRGSILHMLRSDDTIFEKFGEIYFSETNPRITKAWKQHKKQTQNIAVPAGKIQLVIYDDRPESSTRGNIAEYTIGRPNHYRLIRIPPMLWYGFQPLENQPALIANCVDQSHDPLEVETISADSDQIPYQWK